MHPLCRWQLRREDRGGGSFSKFEGRQEISIVDPTRSVEKVSMKISPNAGP
jgi:hypothetical protein